MYFVSLLLILILVSSTTALIGTDGVCEFFVFVPYTILGEIDSGSLVQDNSNYGFSHTAAALLAMEHFNDRNPVVVPELAELQGCNVQLKLDRVFDTGAFTQMSSCAFFENYKKSLCGIVGPFTDEPNNEIGMMAQAAKVPHIAHRAYNLRLVSDVFNSFSSQVYPDMLEVSKTLVSFLLSQGRTNYIAVLYALSDLNAQRREVLSFQLDANGMEWISSTYVSPAASGAFATKERTPLEALKVLKKSGYRTIVVAMDWVYDELEAIADAAEELGMNQGDYLWVWYDTVEPWYFLFSGNDNIDKLVRGSAWMLPIASDAGPGFDTTWRAQGKDGADRLNAANPIVPDAPGYRFANTSFFEDSNPEYGTRLMYDAVMALGLGACRVQQDGGNVSGTNHLEGVRNTSFSGASGLVAFGTKDGDTGRVGTRRENTISYAVLNFLQPPDSEFTSVLPAISTFKDRTDWTQEIPFVYADGSTDPPPLIDDFEQNHLSTGLRATGFTLMGLSMLASTISAAFVFLQRKHRVVKASQPPFLYLLIAGTFIEASAILTVSFDEGSGWSEEQLSKACMATPWLFSLGTIIVYSALFTKMWRVHEVLQFRRRQVKVKQVIWPFALLVVSALLVLSLWTGLDSLEWVRFEIDDITHESIGECKSDHTAAFLVPLLVLCIIPMVMTGHFAWKTKDVDEQFTESHWIFALFVVQMEVVVIAAPVLVLLRDVSVQARYVGLVVLFFTLPTSTLGLIILPKYLAYRRAVRGLDKESKAKRGAAIGETRVTGINVNHTEETARRNDTEASRTREPDVAEN